MKEGINTIKTKLGDIQFQTEKEVIEKLQTSSVYKEFENLNKLRRQEFLNFCTGKNMTALTYDKIFKKIFNFEQHPDRLKHFLSAVLGFEVEVLQILPVESEQMNEYGSVLVMDILVKTIDGTIINVEMQRIPYTFNGKRVSCYLSDLVMRQYNQVKAMVKEDPTLTFTYEMMKPVYCLIFFDKSSAKMKELPHSWEDVGQLQFDSGLKEEFLEHIHYIELDKFRENVQTISNEKERWVSLLSADTPEKVQEVAASSVEMFEIIAEVAEYTMDAGEVMNMYSEALRILDRNTEKYMMDEAMKQLEEKDKTIEEQGKALEEQGRALEEKDKDLEKERREKEVYQREIEELKKQLAQKK
jgi:predicted transposase/invertase (TIGR01784 family)